MSELSMLRIVASGFKEAHLLGAKITRKDGRPFPKGTEIAITPGGWLVNDNPVSEDEYVIEYLEPAPTSYQEYIDLIRRQVGSEHR